MNTIDAVFSYLREFNFASVLFRLLLATTCGGLIGYGRARRRRAAGFRTFMLTCLGSALTVLIACYDYKMLTGDWADVVKVVGMKFDAGRYASQVVSGIGFLGAGTILDAPTAAMYLQTGADFLVSPCCVDEVITLANRRGVPYSPGCGTVTEIVHAQERGCDLVKVFPAGTVGGPAFVKNILAPLPWAMVMATGAVEPTEENLTAWAKSGVTAVGMGSKLFPKEVIASGDWASISALCRKCLAWFNKS